MRQQSPSLLIILRATTDIIAPRNNPDHPPGLLGRQVLSKALGIRLSIRAPILRKPPLSQQQREMLNIRSHVQRLKTIVIQARLQARAVGDIVGVRVQLEDDLVGGEVVAGEGPRARGEGCAADDGGEEGVEVEAGEDDEGVRVGGADCCGALLDVLVPGLPVVCLLEGGVVVGPAGLVAEGEGRQGCPRFGLERVVSTT